MWLNLMANPIVLQMCYTLWALTKCTFTFLFLFYLFFLNLVLGGTDVDIVDNADVDVVDDDDH